MTLNTSKTQALLVTRRRIREVPSGPLVLNGCEIEWEHEAKYLGMYFDKTMTLKRFIEDVLDKTQNAIRVLYPLIHRKSTLSPENKTLIFKCALRPIYTYACPLFSDIADTHIKKLQVQQNKILKMIYNMPWHTPTIELHEANNIEFVRTFAERLRQRFLFNLQFIEAELSDPSGETN